MARVVSSGVQSAGSPESPVAGPRWPAPCNRDLSSPCSLLTAGFCARCWRCLSGLPCEVDHTVEIDSHSQLWKRVRRWSENFTRHISMIRKLSTSIFKSRSRIPFRVFKWRFLLGRVLWTHMTWEASPLYRSNWDIASSLQQRPGCSYARIGPFWGWYARPRLDPMFVWSCSSIHLLFNFFFVFYFPDTDDIKF